ncbi:hypothetical protein JCM10207_004280 [Rhodosporidiobolus poonsookiae]
MSWQPVSSSPLGMGGEAMSERESGSTARTAGAVEEGAGVKQTNEGSKGAGGGMHASGAATFAANSPAPSPLPAAAVSPIKRAAGLPPTQASSQMASLPSPTQKRTKEEIAAMREAALARRKQKDDQKKAEDRQRKREDLAKMQLANFGFSIKPAISRFGSGSGGVPVKSELEVAPKEWTPDERCSDEQKKVLEQVKAGGNVFFTGSAGVGKSFLLHEINRLLEHVKRPFQVTATTGIAALQVSGVTIHSWAGVGLGKEPISVLYDRIASNKTKLKPWLETQTLIIDEISMSPADLFTKLNLLGKMLRNNNKPFGGIQLVVCGDFFQLPPVPDKKSEEKCMRCGHQNLRKLDIHDSRLAYEQRAKGVVQADIYRCTDTVKQNKEVVGGCGFEWRNRRFVFETESWAECGWKIFELTKVFRQDAPDFIATLEKFRRGICDEACIEFLRSCGSELGKGGNIKIQPTNLYPLRRNVDEENDREFKKLKEPAYTFQALDDSRGGYGRMQMKERLANVPPVERLQLKKGAQVLLLANLDVKNGLVNGSRGVIVDWVDKNDVPVDADEVESARYASQTRTVRSGAFGGEEWREKAAEEWADKQGEAFYPIVYFATGRQLIIKPHSWCIDIDKDNTVARTQLPLALAWALTIHKSQGQSLDAVGVRLTSTFEKGQAYVALSRCRTPAGMKIEGFKPGVVMAHPTVKIFYECISSGDSFFITPVPPVNPLAFLPDFDPLLHKLSRVFGRLPAPLPVGSAVLAPGQKAPPPRPAAPASTVATTATAALVPPLQSVTPAAGDWRALLAQAARTYLADSARPENDGLEVDSSAFAAEARRALAAALTGAGGAAGTTMAGPEMAMQPDAPSEYETAESAVSSAGAEGETAGSSAPGGKRKKKKRARKRVGH